MRGGLKADMNILKADAYPFLHVRGISCCRRVRHVICICEGERLAGLPEINMKQPPTNLKRNFFCYTIARPQRAANIRLNFGQSLDRGLNFISLPEPCHPDETL